MEALKDTNDYGQTSEEEDEDERSHDDEGDQFDEDEDDEDILNEEEQMFLQQQIENEFMNAGDEESDDGLVLAGEGNAASPYN